MGSLRMCTLNKPFTYLARMLRRQLTFGETTSLADVSCSRLSGRLIRAMTQLCIALLHWILCCLGKAVATQRVISGLRLARPKLKRNRFGVLVGSSDQYLFRIECVSK